MNSFTNNPVLGHITTFGGNPVCCAAASATIDVIINEKLAEGAEKKGELFKKLLVHPSIKAVRGTGLLLAVEFENEKINFECIKRCIENGLIADWFLFAPQCMRLAPPLIISEEEILRACKIILLSL